jgi:hypothetical protein
MPRKTRARAVVAPIPPEYPTSLDIARKQAAATQRQLVVSDTLLQRGDDLLDAWYQQADARRMPTRVIAFDFAGMSNLQRTIVEQAAQRQHIRLVQSS